LTVYGTDFGRLSKDNFVFLSLRKILSR